MKTIFVKPKKGLVVRDPQTMKPVPETGAMVPLDSFWRRRLNSGDVVKSMKPKKKGGDDK